MAIGINVKNVQASFSGLQQARYIAEVGVRHDPHPALASKLKIVDMK